MCCPVPERREEVRDEDGEVVAPEPVVFITLECSGVCLPIAQRMLFPFIPIGTVMEKDHVKTRGKEDHGTQGWWILQSKHDEMLQYRKHGKYIKLHEAEEIHEA